MYSDVDQRRSRETRSDYNAMHHRQPTTFSHRRRLMNDESSFASYYPNHVHNYHHSNGLRKDSTYSYSTAFLTDHRSTAQLDSEEVWYAKLEKKVRESIPVIVERYHVISYKDIEEELVKKLRYSKNEFNYLQTLDDLRQNKQIYLVHQKPDVFSIVPEVSTDKLQQYLTYLEHVKSVNKIRNAPKNSSKNLMDKTIHSNNEQNSNHSNVSQIETINTKNKRSINDESSSDVQITATAKSENVTSQASNQSNITNKQCKCQSSESNDAQTTKIDLEKEKTENQCKLITSSSSSNIDRKAQNDDQLANDDHKDEEQKKNEENCGEDSIEDLSNKIVISNMVASKGGDKQKANRRKARRIRKAAKNCENKRNSLESNDEEEKENEDDCKSIENIVLQEHAISSTRQNLKYENSSQISSSDSETKQSFEVLPDSEIYPSEDICQKISDAGFDYESIITRFANWNRSPISALNEFGQIVHISVKLEITDSSGPDHSKLFQSTAFLDKRKLSVAWGKSKKRAKCCASELAIRAITASLPSERCDLDIKKYENHFDRLAVLSYAKFNELLVLVPNYVNFGRKIVATVLMRTPDDKYGQVVAMGTGNRCVSGEFLVTNGKVIFDSHAEVIARRSFLNFLMKQIEFYKTNEHETIFVKDPESELLMVKPEIEFHLYISTAPCGDGALFTHSSTRSCCVELSQEDHQPLFETFLHGRLRTKMEAGEGTISLDQNYVSPELDQILRGERLRTMSCSDKICRWNLLGIQGSLLLHFIKPIYLKSISLGALYHDGHLSRACCCRLDKDYFEDILKKNEDMFKINHPSLGCPTSFKFPREPVKTKSDSLNWSMYEEVPELTNGNTGLKFNMEESRICKFELFNRFKKLCALYDKSDLNQLTYYEVKAKVTNYNELKEKFFEFLKHKQYGPWVCKPMETKVFK